MTVQHRKQLSVAQIKLLGLLGKYRFATVELLSDMRDRSKSAIYGRLALLEDQGYLHKRFEKRWKLLGRPAIYTLTGKGLRVIRDYIPGYFTEAVIRNQYKNRSASLQLVDHSLDLAKLCIQLHKQYDCEYLVFSKSEIDQFSEFLRPLPDLYINTNRMDEDNRPIRYQVELIEAGTLTWMIKKRINAHQAWCGENSDTGWQFEGSYPTLLFVCDNKSTEKRIHRLTDWSYLYFDTWTTTRERLNTGKKAWVRRWSAYENEMELMEL